MKLNRLEFLFCHIFKYTKNILEFQIVCIKTFKNWLLARDSSSRISSEPTYRGFFESNEDNNEALRFRFPRSNR